jgi:hypothetical protein
MKKDKRQKSQDKSKKAKVKGKYFKNSLKPDTFAIARLHDRVYNLYCQY